MKLIRKAGATSNIFQVFIADSSSTTGAGLTGLVFNSGSLTAYYHRDTDTTATAITLVTMTVGTFTSSGFKEIDATNMPGWYQFCPPDAAIAAGAKSVGFHLKGASNMAPLPIEVDLDAQVDVTFWNGTAVSSPATAGIPDVNVKNINNVAAATPGASGGILISGSNSGTTTLGALTVTGATTHTGATIHTGNVSMAAGLTITQSSSNTAGVDITGNGTAAGIKTTGGATGNGVLVNGGATSGDGVKVVTVNGHGVNLAPVGASVHGFFSTGGNSGTSDGMKLVAGTGGVPLRANITGDITGNLSGSVGSVTGAVGSVTGAVGSVTARVTANTDQLAGQTVSAAAGVTFPASVASPTNITSATGVDITKILGTSISAPATAGILDVNVKNIDNDAASASGTVTFPNATLASTTNITAASGVALSSGGIQAIWDALTSALTTAGSVGKLIVDNVNATISSRLASASITLSGGAVTVGTNNDKTGYGISAAAVQSVWDALTSALTTSGSIGKWILDKLDVVVSTRLATSGYTVPPTAAANADAVWDETLADHLTSGSTGNALNAAGAAGDPWSTALPGAYGSGTAGKIVGDNINATISSRSTYAGGDTSGTTTLLSRIASALTITGGKVDVNDKTGFSLSSAGIQAVWDALTSALTTAGSIGKLLADNINATISSRASQTSVDTIDDFVDTEVAAIKAKTDLIPASPAAVGSAMTLTSAYDAAKTAAQPGDVPTANANADALLDRSNGIETSWTPRQSLRIMLAVLGGKLSGAATTTATMRDVGDNKNRVVATVDVDGNRTSVSYDKT